MAWLAVPLLAAQTLSKSAQKPEEHSKLTLWVHEQYTRLMQLVLPRPWLVLGALALLLSGGFIAEQTVGSGFMPAMDEGGFILDYRAESGTSVTETDRLLQQVEDIIQQTPEVETYSRRTGLSLGGHITEANEGDFFIKLKPMPRRNLEDIMSDIRSQILGQVPGLEVEMAKLMEDMIGDLTAVPQPIEIKLYADNGELLTTVAENVAAAISKIPGVVDINSGVIPAGDALTVKILPEKAALAGLTSDEIKLALNAYLTGTMATQIQEGIKMLNVRVWLPEAERTTGTQLKNLPIRTTTGQWVPLQRVAEISTEIGQPQIHRENLKRMVAVTARLEGRDLGSAIVDIEQTLHQANLLPAPIYYVLGGLYAEQQIAFKDMLAVFMAAVALVFLLLLMVYESFRVATAMIITTLSSMAAVYIGLWLTHTELNIMAIMGMTMVIGIVTEVAVFYYSEYENLSAIDKQGIAGFSRAGNNRMRPIAMTTIAAIFALLPLALGIGTGAEMLQPLAIALIFGLVIQIPLVLVLLPCLLRQFDRLNVSLEK